MCNTVRFLLVYGRLQTLKQINKKRLELTDAGTSMTDSWYFIPKMSHRNEDVWHLADVKFLKLKHGLFVLWWNFQTDDGCK